MTLLSENIRHLRKSCSFTQQDLADKIEIKRSLVGAYEEGRAEPPVATLLNIANVFGVTIDDLVSLDHTTGKYTKSTSSDGVRVLSISVDSNDEEYIEIVPQKAAAGYLNGYADPEYIKDLPKFQLPTLPKNATYRAFEISGDSMLPIQPGSIVIGEFVESIKDIKNGHTYVLVTEKEGVVYKRVFNYLDEKGMLYLVSDNEMYSPYEISADEVIEVWSAKTFISSSLPSAPDEEKMTMDKLAKIVLDLQKEIIKLKER